VLNRRRSTPVPAWVLVAGRSLTAIGISLVTMVVLLAVGRFAYGVHLPTRTIPASRSPYGCVNSIPLGINTSRSWVRDPSLPFPQHRTAPSLQVKGSSLYQSMPARSSKVAKVCRRS
jgi:hypothetical protein